MKTINFHNLALAMGARHKQGSTYHCFVPGNHKDGDRGASMTISPGQTGDLRFVCGGCGIAGDEIKMVMIGKSLNFIEARKWLENWSGVELSTKRKIRSRKRNIEKPLITPLRAQIMQDLWEVVRDSRKYSESVEEWVHSRALNYSSIVNHGGIDSIEFLRVAYKFLKGLDNAERQQTGLWSTGFKLFYPFLKKSPGVMIPQYHPEFNFPISWRWRSIKNGTGKKSLSTYGTLGSLPLGLRSECDYFVNVEKAETILICEGEPDYYSLLSILHDLGLTETVGIMGIVGGYWRDWWTPLMKNASKIVLLTHIDQGKEAKSEKLTMKIFESIKEINGVTASKNLYQYPVHGHRDLNDLLQDGVLIEVIEEILK